MPSLRKVCFSHIKMGSRNPGVAWLEFEQQPVEQLGCVTPLAMPNGKLGLTPERIKRGGRG
jgi:hypothetical protein